MGGDRTWRFDCSKDEQKALVIFTVHIIHLTNQRRSFQNYCHVLIWPVLQSV